MFSKLWIKLGLVIAIVGGIAALLAYGFIRDSRYIYSPLVAKPAPSFTLTLFDGGTLNDVAAMVRLRRDLKTLLAGKLTS
jgi:hypothetical protein